MAVLSSNTGIYNLEIIQGADFDREFYLLDSSGAKVSLTGYTWLMHIRKTKDASSTLLTVTPLTHTGKSRVILNVSAATTAALDFTDAVWDLEGTNSGEVTRLLEGTVHLNREVTY